MTFGLDQLSRLRQRVRETLGVGRYLHTLGVERAAIRLGEQLCPEDISELSVAALLHDITKELSEEEQLEILKNIPEICDSDIKSASVHHSLTAPYVIERDFAEFATERVLEAVRNHTTGDEGMSVFDEIIFISDYIEDGRTYEGCVNVRDALYSELEGARTSEDKLRALRRAVLSALDNTVVGLVKSGRVIHERTVYARNYILGALLPQHTVTGD